MRLLPLAAAILAASLVSGCMAALFTPPGEVVIVRDLGKVAGCRFMGTVAPPPVAAGLRSAAGYEAYVAELRRRAAALGGTHLYLLNEAAGWGAARALGTAYRCIG